MKTGKNSALATGHLPLTTNLAGATGNCNNCPHWRRKGSKRRGVRIPLGQFGWGFGKCIRPQGHCHPQKVKS